MFVIDNRKLKLAPLERRDLSPQLRDARGVAGLLGVRQLPPLEREARRRVELTTPRLALRANRVSPFGLARVLRGELEGDLLVLAWEAVCDGREHTILSDLK